MQKAFVLTVALAAAAMVSGCALIGKYSKPAAGGGTQTTVGLISIDSVSDGYPMIPFYNSYQQGGK